MTGEVAEETVSMGGSLIDGVGKSLSLLGSTLPRLVVLHGGAPLCAAVEQFQASHPQRAVDFGNAHQTMIGAAAGLASVGLLPVIVAPAAFLLKGMEQIRLSLGCAEASVKIVGTHAGLAAGARGAAFQTLEDVAAFRAVPGIAVIAPASEREAELAARDMLERDGPVYLRVGDETAAGLACDAFEFGKGTIVRNGTDVTIVACGALVERAVQAATLLVDDNIDARVVNLSTIKPIDSDLLARCAGATGAIVTAEDHSILGGLGGAVAEALAGVRPCPIEFVGVRDVFGRCGTPEQLAAHFGIGADRIAEAAKRAIVRKLAHREDHAERRLAS